MATQPKPKVSISPRQSDAGASSSAQADALSRLAGAGAAVQDPDSPGTAPVYWAEGGDMRERGLGNTRVAGDSKFITRDEAYQKVWDWYGTPEFDKWGDYLVELGVIDEGDKGNPNVLAPFWQEAVDASANLTSAGKKVKPWDAARLLAGQSAQKSTASSKAGTWTSSSKSVNLTDPATAKALVNDVLTRQLGRAATQEEIAAFTSVLHSAQNANPTITTQTGTSDEMGNTTQSTSTSGGLDAAGAQQVLQDRAMQLPDYGAHQAATTYANAFFSAINSPV